MLKDKLHIKNLKGFSTIEVILALTLISMISIALASALSYGIFSQSQANMENKANYLLSEGIEAVTNIKDASFANLTDGTYGLSLSGGTWTFLGTSDTVDGYTRSVQISTVDTNTKQIQVNVNWQNSSASRSISTTAQITNWERTVVVTSWATPSLEASVNLTGTVDGIEVALNANNKLLIGRTGNASNFVVVDVSTLTAPVVQGTISLTGTLTEIAYSGNYAYVTSTNNAGELYVVNITTPTAPTFTTINMAGNADANGVFVVGNRLYISRSTSADPEFYVYDITTPATPTLLGSVQYASNLFKFFVEGSYAYVASAADTAELSIFNISTPATPTFTSGLDLSGATDATDIARYSAGVALQRGTVVSLASITNPLAPTALNSAGFSVGATSLSITGDTNYPYIFQSDATANQFTIYNVTNPTTVTTLSSLAYTGNLNDLIYSQSLDRVFGVGSNDTLEIVIYKPN